MNFLKTKTCWTNAEFGLLKLCMASIYLVAGSYFHEFFGRYHLPLLLLFVITGAWLFYLWVIKMKSNPKP